MVTVRSTVTRREVPWFRNKGFLSDLIKSLNVNKAFANEVFNYFEDNPLPHVHFPDEKVENNNLGHNRPYKALYNL